MKSSSFRNQPDTLIWERFKEGDEEALSFIYLHYHKHLVNYGLRLCRDEEQVEDCIHDMFLELWKGRAGLSATNSIRFYLLKVLRNKIHSHLKATQPRSDVDLYADNYHFAVEYSFEEQWVQQIGDEELRGKLLTALNNLSARQKEAIYLRFYDNLDYPEISAIMGISYQSTRTQVYQAIKSLREQLAVELPVVWLLFTFFSGFLPE